MTACIVKLYLLLVLAALAVKGTYRRRGKGAFSARLVKPGEFPFIVFIVSTLDFEIKCGGSLKAADVVLTSCNCISSAKGEFMNLKYLAVVGGIVHYYDVNGEGRQVRKVLDKKAIDGKGECKIKEDNIVYLILKTPFTLDTSVSTANYGAFTETCDDCEVVAFSVSNGYIRKQLAEEYEDVNEAKMTKHFPLRAFTLNRADGCRSCGKARAHIKNAACFPCNYCEGMETGSVLVNNGTPVGHFLSSAKCAIRSRSSFVAIFYSYKNILDSLSHSVKLTHHSSLLPYVLISLMIIFSMK